MDAARLKQAAAKRLEVRPLSAAEMKQFTGRGPYRNKYFAGTLPWHRSLRDVNLSNGNLFKSFTDIQVAPAKGAGLAMQRIYNSMDDRIGPFGQGWTHAYDIRTQEENPDTNYTDDSLNTMDRADFFGGRHKYHRDADGLYTPPPYLFDETDSDYDKFLVSGPIKSLDDVEHGMDGTVKHFVTFQNSLERVCDFIEDRYGNRTNLVYTQATVGGQTVNLLQSVTDPSGRQILYTWSNLGSSEQPAYRITAAQGPAYSVTYAYNGDLNLDIPTLPIEFDVHEVRAHPYLPAIVAAATTVGLCISQDAGLSWEVRNEGLEITNSLAVAVLPDEVLFSIQEGPFAARSQVWRWQMDGGGLERVRDGLPLWLEGKIDIVRIAACDGRAAIADGGGNLWLSGAGSREWERIATDIPSGPGILIV